MSFDHFSRYTYTTLDQEALETSDPSLDQRYELVGVARDNASIESYIHPTLALRRLNLLLKPCHGRCWWDGIERHINHRRDTPTSRCPSPRPEALPLRPTWLV